MVIFKHLYLAHQIQQPISKMRIQNSFKSFSQSDFFYEKTIRNESKIFSNFRICTYFRNWLLDPMNTDMELFKSFYCG